MRNKKGQFIDGRAGIRTRYTREGSLGNQWAKGNPPNRTSFNGTQVLDKHPCWKGGLQRGKDGYVRAYAPRKRMPNARWIWQQVNGELPKHPRYVVIHLDGDKWNDDINNLEAITCAENLARNRK